MPCFTTILLLVWGIGFLWLLVRLHIPAMEYELHGASDHIWSIVICITWPLWGLVMLYYRFKKQDPC